MATRSTTATGAAAYSRRRTGVNAVMRRMLYLRTATECEARLRLRTRPRFARAPRLQRGRERRTWEEGPAGGRRRPPGAPGLRLLNALPDWRQDTQTRAGVKERRTASTGVAIRACQGQPAQRSGP